MIILWNSKFYCDSHNGPYSKAAEPVKNFQQIYLFHFNIIPLTTNNCRSQWPRGLRRRSAAARLLRLWVRIPPGAWIAVYCECCLLSGRGLWDEPIIRPEESYRQWRVVVCDLETS